MTRAGNYLVCGECGQTLPADPAPLGTMIVLPDLEWLPYPVALTAQRLAESHRQGRDRIRLHLELKDCFEAGLRYLGSILLAEYLQSDRRSAERDERLLTRLVRPSLGDWRGEIVAELAKLLWPDRHSPGFDCAGIFLEPVVQAGARPRERELMQWWDRFVTMRNDTIGHGPEQIDQAYENLFRQHWPAVEGLLNSIAGQLADWRLCLVADVDRCQVWMGPQAPRATVPGAFRREQIGHFILHRVRGTRDGEERQALDLYPLLCYTPGKGESEQRLHYYDKLTQYKAGRKLAKVVEYDLGNRHDREEPVPGLEAALTAELLGQAFGAERSRREAVEGRVLGLDELIEAHADIVGRECVIERVEAFLQERDRGVLLIVAEPGKGKTALLAYLIERRYGDRMPPAVHFFYRRTAGITSPDVCVRSLHASLLRSSARLMRGEEVRDPDGASPPADPNEEFTRLHNLLHQHLGPRLGPGSPLLIFIDALDEADPVAGRSAFDRIPPLPAHVFAIATSRPVTALAGLRRREDVECLDLDSRELEAEHLQDGRAYVHRQTLGAAVPATTLEEMARVGAGNFQVLRLLCLHIREHARPGEILPLLARLARGGREHHLGLTYEAYWQEMCHGLGREDTSLLCRVAGALLEAERPVPAEVVCEVLDIRRGDWEWVLGRLRPFLAEVRQEEGGIEEKFYRLYHESFAEFLRGRLAGIEEVTHRWAAYCAGWAGMPEGFAGSYALRFAPRHLLKAKDYAGVVGLLTDLDYLQACLAAGRNVELAEALEEAREAIPTADSGRAVLALLRPVIQENADFLWRRPEDLFACVQNRYGDAGVQAGESVPSFDPIQPVLQRWREEVTRRGTFWVRSRRPHAEEGSGRGPQFRGHLTPVERVVVSGCGRRFATLSPDVNPLSSHGVAGSLRVWRMGGGELLSI
jgi:hypothetical protein